MVSHFQIDDFRYTDTTYVPVATYILDPGRWLFFQEFSTITQNTIYEIYLHIERLYQTLFFQKASFSRSLKVGIVW